MDFAKKLMNKYGWKEGNGLGRNNDGINRPLKASLKFDNSGFGADIAASDFNNRWWERCFNEAAQNVEVKEEQDGVVSMNLKNEDSVEITTKGYSMKKLKKAKQSEEHGRYNNFLQSATLTKEGTEIEKSDKIELTDIAVKEYKVLTDEELLRACGGRTAHKGARHGLRLSGKLLRLEKQEKEMLAKILEAQTKSMEGKAKEASPREEIKRKHDFDKLDETKVSTDSNDSEKTATALVGSIKKTSKKSKTYDESQDPFQENLITEEPADAIHMDAANQLKSKKKKNKKDGAFLEPEEIQRSKRKILEAQTKSMEGKAKEASPREEIKRKLDFDKLDETKVSTDSNDSEKTATALVGSIKKTSKKSKTYDESQDPFQENLITEEPADAIHMDAASQLKSKKKKNKKDGAFLEPEEIQRSKRKILEAQTKSMEGKAKEASPREEIKRKLDFDKLDETKVSTDSNDSEKTATALVGSIKKTSKKSKTYDESQDPFQENLITEEPADAIHMDAASQLKSKKKKNKKDTALLEPEEIQSCKKKILEAQTKSMEGKAKEASPREEIKRKLDFDKLDETKVSTDSNDSEKTATALVGSIKKTSKKSKTYDESQDPFQENLINEEPADAIHMDAANQLKSKKKKNKKDRSLLEPEEIQRSKKKCKKTKKETVETTTKEPQKTKKKMK